MTRNSRAVRSAMYIVKPSKNQSKSPSKGSELGTQRCSISCVKMTLSCPIQVSKCTSGSMSNTTVEPLVSAFHFEPANENGDGAIAINDLPGNLNPVRAE